MTSVPPRKVVPTSSDGFLPLWFYGPDTVYSFNTVLYKMTVCFIDSLCGSIPAPLSAEVFTFHPQLFMPWLFFFISHMHFMSSDSLIF